MTELEEKVSPSQDDDSKLEMDTIDAKLETLTKIELIREIKRLHNLLSESDIAIPQPQSQMLTSDEVTQYLDEIDQPPTTAAADNNGNPPNTPPPQLSTADIYRRAMRMIDESKTEEFMDFMDRYGPNFDINTYNDQATRNKSGMTLLGSCCEKNEIQMVKYLLRTFATLNIERGSKNPTETPMDICEKMKYYIIIEMLSLHRISVNVKQKLKSYQDRRSQLLGITETFAHFLKERCRKESKLRNYYEIVMTILEDSLIACINERKSFSEDILLLVWKWTQQKIANSNGKNQTTMLNSKLWTHLQSQIRKTLNIETLATNRCAWQWFSENLHNSIIWVEPTNEAPKTEQKSAENVVNTNGNTRPNTESISEKQTKPIFYYKLLEIVLSEITSQRSALRTEFKRLIDVNPQSWDNVVQLKYNNPRYQTTDCRQDRINAELNPTYSAQQLQSLVGPRSEFDCVSFADLNSYLSELMIRAHALNPTFTTAMETFVDTHFPARKPVFTSGPVKSLSRCQAKAELDYTDEEWPTSAKLLDLIRCSLTFGSLQDFHDGIEKFVNYVVGENDDRLVEIVRMKNGFSHRRYSKSKQIPDGYCDVKINVVVRHNNISIVGEIQFLLAPILAHKKKLHKLYEIQRIDSLIDTSYEIRNLRTPERAFQMAIATNNATKTASLVATYPLYLDTIDWNEPLNDSGTTFLMDCMFRRKAKACKALFASEVVLSKIDWDATGYFKWNYLHYVFAYCDSLDELIPILKAIPPNKVAPLLAQKNEADATPILLASKIQTSYEVLEYIYDTFGDKFNWEEISRRGLTILHGAVTNLNPGAPSQLRLVLTKMPKEARIKLINQKEDNLCATPLAMALHSRGTGLAPVILELCRDEIDWKLTMLDSGGEVFHKILTLRSARYANENPLLVIQSLCNAMPQEIGDKVMQSHSIMGQTPFMVACELNKPPQVLAYLLDTYPQAIAQTLTTTCKNDVTPRQYFDKWAAKYSDIEELEEKMNAVERIKYVF